MKFDIKVIKYLWGLISFLSFILIFELSTAQVPTNSELLTPAEQAWIAENPIVRVSNSSDFPPVSFVSARQPSGFAVDYTRLVAAKVGLKINFISDVVWQNTIQKLKNKELDIINILSKTDERSQFFSFTPSYLDLPIVHYGRAGSDKVNSAKDLNNKKIGLLTDSLTAEAYQKQHPNLNYVFYDDLITALNALALGGIDVYTGYRVPIEYSISEYNIQGLEELSADFDFEYKELDQRFAVHKDNQTLLNILNKGMAAVTQEEYSIIEKKWQVTPKIDNSTELTAEELNWLSENNIIKVSAKKSTFPFEFIDEEGRISGISGDFLDEISKQLNINFIWAGNKTWNEGLLKIKSHDADMIAMITPTKERQSFLEFSDIFMSSNFVIVSRDDGTVFTNINTLDGRTIAQVKGTVILSYLRENYSNIKVIETDTREEAHELISSGGADAILEDITEAIANISNFGFDNLSIVGTSPYGEATAMGISSELPLLSSAIQKALTNIDNETRSAIFTRWLTRRIETKVDYGPLWAVIGIFLLIGIIILIWNKKLNTEIKQRKLIQRKLNSVQNRYERTIEGTNEGIWEWNLRTGALYLSPRWAEILGYDLSELRPIAKTFTDIIHPDDKDRVFKSIAANFKSRTPDIIEIQMRKKTGEYLWIQARGKIIWDEEGQPEFLSGSITDIKKRKLTEEKLRQSQKMDSLGRLSGGIAHDFNNILAIISGNLEVMEILSKGNKKILNCIDTAHKGARRGAVLTKKLMGFSKQAPYSVERIHVNELLANMDELIRATCTASIYVKMDLAENLWPLYADAGDLEDAIFNLVLNARDAMSSGGSLLIRTTNKVIDKHYADRHPDSKMGEFIMISVSDTGAGMTTEVISKFLEPFFTTKPVGEGTGLGLSMVQGFLKRAEGHINLNTALGDGTTIMLLFPRASTDLINHKPTNNGPPKLKVTGNETILIVDDEEALRIVAKTHLAELGYNIYLAANAKEALEVIEKHKNIDLLFSDVVMPGTLNGFDLATKVSKIEPSIKILLTSGFNQHLEKSCETIDEQTHDLAKALLYKPYNKTELAISVRQALDG